MDSLYITVKVKVSTTQYYSSGISEEEECEICIPERLAFQLAIPTVAQELYNSCRAKVKAKLAEDKAEDAKA